MSDRSKSPSLPPDLERRIERAEAAVAVLRPKFRLQIDKDVARLNAIAGGELTETALLDLRNLVHDLKGTAGGFGFNLVSEIAACFTDYLDAIDTLQPRDIEVIRKHADSIAVAAGEPLLAEEREQVAEFIRLARQLTADARDNP